MYRIRSVEDAQQRLFKTVVMHDGNPVYVDKVLGAQEVEGRNLLTGKRERFNLNPTSTLPPTVGFINYEGYAIFVTRRPVRRVRQGLCAENISLSIGSREEVVRSTAFGKMLVRDYPSVKNAIKWMVDNGLKGIAFSLNFAMYADGSLLYQTTKVGQWKEDGSLELNPKFKCLQEVLDADSK